MLWGKYLNDLPIVQYMENSLLVTDSRMIRSRLHCEFLFYLFIRDVRIVFFWYSILGTKNSIFSHYRLSADARNWFRQASSTDDESGCALSTRWRFVGGPVCSLASRSSLAASAAAVVHSSNSHCLAHTSFGAQNSHLGYRGSTTVATTYRRSSVTARQSRHQKASRRRLLASRTESDYC